MRRRREEGEGVTFDGDVETERSGQRADPRWRTVRVRSSFVMSSRRDVEVRCLSKAISMLEFICSEVLHGARDVIRTVRCRRRRASPTLQPETIAIMSRPREITGTEGSRIKVFLGETGGDYLYFFDEDDGSRSGSRVDWTTGSGSLPWHKQLNAAARGVAIEVAGPR